MLLTPLKNLLLPREPRPVRIRRGPFRGAVIHMSLRDNLRKIFGLYERQFNDWLEAVLPGIDTVLDVGANDGYFTFGCAAAFRRLGKSADILGFEPQQVHIDQLESSRRQQPAGSDVNITVTKAFVGDTPGEGMTTLDAVAAGLPPGRPTEARRTLVKIDVEGAEPQVIRGASRWLRPGNHFLIEVHAEADLATLRTMFTAAGLGLEERFEQPLPLLGREQRVLRNWWLVTPLPASPGGPSA